MGGVDEGDEDGGGDVRVRCMGKERRGISWCLLRRVLLFMTTPCLMINRALGNLTGRGLQQGLYDIRTGNTMLNILL